jgi:formylglycine-generating enzyme required for sulfatase activity
MEPLLLRRHPRGLFPALAALAAGACASHIPTSGAPLHRPIPARAFWAGLPQASPEASPRGDVVLRPPLDGRVPVPGGTFTMGSSPVDIERAQLSCMREPAGAQCGDGEEKLRFAAELPAHEVTLSPYLIDRTEVTVAAYACCVANDACPPRARASRGPQLDGPDLPVTYVGWDAAVAYCAWAGGRLPTEAEWELAARGAEGRQYPWGDVYNPFLCNHGSFAADRVDATDGFAGLAPVGTYPDGATPLGVLDLAGNVAEWVSDYYWTDEKGFGYEAASQVNPTGSKFGALHVVRGGSYLDGAAWLRGASRAFSLGPSPTVGFRCAASVR